MKNKNITRMVQLAILLAVVVVLQCFLGSIKVGATSFSVVLVPIVVGALILGPAAGAFLGFAFCPYCPLSCKDFLSGYKT